MSPSPIRLNDGHPLPTLGFGTWPLDNQEAEAAVRSALKSGYRLIDTAAKYGNEAGVGRAIREGGIARDEIVLTSKLAGDDHGYEQTLRGFEHSAKVLGVERIDLYLIHWPLPRKELYVDSWKALIRLRDEGRIRSIGVSNFLAHHIERLEAETGVLPAVDQIELHPDFAQPQLRAWLQAKGITVEAWSPLGRGEVLENPALRSIADKHGVSTAQVVLRWHQQHGVVPLPKSQTPARIAANIDLAGFSLDQAELAAIDALDRNARQGGDPDTWEE